MFYAISLMIVGVLLVLCGLIARGWAYAFCWLGFSFVLLGLAHFAGRHGIFGKRPDGTLPLWSKLLHLPFFLITTLAWRAICLLGREPAYHRVIDDLVIGRRLLGPECGDEFTNYVDLTAEFEEPRTVRQKPCYVSYPILDGGAPAVQSLREMVTKLRPGKTYIHCAQGHGRSAVVALAVLLANGTVKSVEEGLRLLVGARQAVRLNRPQRRCIESFARAMAERGDVKK